MDLVVDNITSCRAPLSCRLARDAGEGAGGFRRVGSLGPGCGGRRSSCDCRVTGRWGGLGINLRGFCFSAGGPGCGWPGCEHEGGQDRSGMSGESSRESIAVTGADSGGSGFTKECVGLIS